MNSKQQTAVAEQAGKLQHFEKLLKYSSDDQSAMQTVFRTIRELLVDSHDAEPDIRRILDSSHAEGELDDDTYITVKRMVDRIVFDFHATMPESGADFSNTEVIAKKVEEPENLAERLQAGTVLRDRFLLQRKVAGGSMGVVYKALDRRLAEVDEADPWVAIKVLTPKLSRNADALRAIQQEAAKGRCLMHPNIVRFVDLDREDDLYFIVMEWIEGRSLAAILDDPEDDSVDLDMSLSIIVQIGDALEYAHRCGVVHADVKPGNIMVMPNGDVKLIDFGVARIRQTQSKRASKFDPGVLGAATPAYSSMQVLTGEDPVPADDVFSLGCLLYRLVAGHRVFGPRNAAEAAERGMAPERPPILDDPQWRALKRSLAFSRVARHPTPSAFVDDLLGEPTETRVESRPLAVVPVESREPDRGSRRWPIFGGLLAIVAGIGFVGTQTDYLDGVLERLPNSLSVAESERPAAVPDATMTAPAETETIAAPVESDAAEEMVATENGLDEVPAPALSGAPTEPAIASPQATDAEPDLVIASFEQDAVAPVTEEVVELIDPEPLPLATHTVRLAQPGEPVTELDVVLREDGEGAIVEFRRDRDLTLPLALKLEEVGFSGNRSPWEAGQYSVAGEGLMRFEPGQTSAQQAISMMSDPLREPDREVDLIVRELDAPDVVLARIKLTLEDDDQREFEGNLAPNTVAFAVSQVSVAEADPAVQIDVLRFNPDSQAVDVRYQVQDVTATEGEDYFAPTAKTLSFAPGQRTARLLIPLVQDSALESDEAFFLEIAGRDFDTDADIFRRIAVMIRDDDR